VEIAVVAGQSVLTGVAIEYDRSLHDVDPADLVCRPNPYGLRAVEEAIRIGERTGGGNVTVVSFGTSEMSASVRHYLSMGANSAICICDKTLDQLDAYALSLCLCEAIKGRACDLVLCEGQTMDQRGGSVYLAPYLGEMLGLPQVSGATKMELAEGGGYLTVHRKLPRGDREIVRCPLPCVIAVEMEVNEPRYPSLLDRLGSVDKPVVRTGLQALGKDGKAVSGNDSLIHLVHVSPPRGRVKKGLVIDTALSAAERMRLTMTGGALPKSAKKTSLTGEPTKLAEQIIAVAVRQGVVEQSRDEDPNV